MPGSPVLMVWPPPSSLTAAPISGHGAFSRHPERYPHHLPEPQSCLQVGSNTPAFYSQEPGASGSRPACLPPHLACPPQRASCGVPGLTSGPLGWGSPSPARPQEFTSASIFPPAVLWAGSLISILKYLVRSTKFST